MDVRDVEGSGLTRRWDVMVSMKSAKGAFVSGERYVVFGLRRLMDETDAKDAVWKDIKVELDDVVLRDCCAVEPLDEKAIVAEW